MNSFICFQLPFLFAFLRNFFPRQDRLSGDVPSHLAQPCYVALGQAVFQCDTSTFIYYTNSLTNTTLHFTTVFHSSLMNDGYASS